MASTNASTKKRNIVGRSTVGDGPKALVDRAETLQFVFHNFKGMKHERDDYVMFPLPLDAFGYLWQLAFYPKGDELSDIDTEYTSVYLMYAGDKKYTPSAKFTFRCKEHEDPFATTSFSKKNGMWGKPNYLKRNDVLENYLEDDGSLIIEVDLRITVDSKRVWYPKQTHEEKSLKESYMNAVWSLSSSNNPTEEKLKNDTTDVVFVVENQQFPVHKLVLSLHAKTLFTFYKEYVSSKKRKRNGNTGTDDDDDDDDDDRARVYIADMKNGTFQKVLEYIYTVNTTPTLVDAAAAIELLLAAHRFECAELKLYVESVVVDKFVTPTNAASMLLLGDTYHCALLKEAAMKSYWSDPISFRESDTTTASWSEIQESSRLLEELLVYTSDKLVATRNPTAAATVAGSAGETSGAASTGSTMDAAVVDGADDITRTMDVGTLREHLDDANLGLDGSREMLVIRLRNYRQQQQQQQQQHM